MTGEIQLVSRLRFKTAICLVGVLVQSGVWGASGDAIPPGRRDGSLLGREVSVTVHLQDGQEMVVALERLLAHGALLFNANWTAQEGEGRPLTKGNGRPVSDTTRPLRGERGFNR